MKKILKISLIISLVLGLVACSNSNNKIEDNKTSKENNIVNTNSRSKNAKGNDQKNEVKNIDKSLTGEDLVKALLSNYPPPESVYIKSKSKGIGQDCVIETYIQGDSSRIESTSGDITNVYIYNEDDNCSYSYVEGQETGYKMQESNEELQGPSDFELNSVIDDEFAYDEVKFDNVDGKELIYFKATDKEFEDQEIVTEFWYSTEYMYPVKTKMSSESQGIIHETEVLEMKIGGNYKDKMTPPENIKFE